MSVFNRKEPTGHHASMLRYSKFIIHSKVHFVVPLLLSIIGFKFLCFKFQITPETYAED